MINLRVTNLSSIVISSEMCQDAKKFSNTGRVNEFRKLKGAVDDKARKALIRAGESTTALRKGIKGLKPKNFQAHHIIPRELAQKYRDFFKKIKFDYEDGAINGMMVPPDKAILDEAIRLDPKVKAEFRNSAFHKGSHPDYTAFMEGRILIILNQFQNSLKTTSDIQKAKTRLLIQISKAKTNILSNKGTINEITW